MRPFLPLAMIIILGCGLDGATGGDADQQATIRLDATKLGKPVNRRLFGVSLARVGRAQWTRPLGLRSPELTALMNDLRPVVVTIDSNQLELPFFPRGTGPVEGRLGILETLQMIGIERDKVGAKLMATVKGQQIYAKPPHKNWDDVLRFLEKLDHPPEISMRLPLIFTDQGKKFFNMAVSLSPETGANLVHYLNDAADTKLGKLRAANGHPAPYGVRWFVLDNELWIYHQWARMDISQITSQYAAFARAMKAADPGIKLGINLVDDSYPRRFLKPKVGATIKPLLGYNPRVVKPVAGLVDFATYHVYSGLGQEEVPAKLTEAQWKFVLAQSYLKKKYGSAEKHASCAAAEGTSLEVAVDEYAGPLLNLGGALYNADYIMRLLAGKYAFATGWNLGTMEPAGRFGLVKVIQKAGSERYVKRPAYHALWMFTNLVSGSLIDMKIQSPSYQTGVTDTKYFMWPSESAVPCLSAVASLDKDKLTLVVVNRSLQKDVKAHIDLVGFEPRQEAEVYELTGSSVDATNEKNPTNVAVRHATVRGVSGSFAHVFKKHSLTTLVLRRR